MRITLFSFEGAREVSLGAWAEPGERESAWERRSKGAERSVGGSRQEVKRTLRRRRPVGQVVKTAASHAANTSSTLVRVTKPYAPLAQLVEHLTLNQGVQGSSP